LSLSTGKAVLLRHRSVVIVGVVPVVGVALSCGDVGQPSGAGEDVDESNDQNLWMALGLAT
jgi:hypothetical protein